jgi:putative ATPase
MMAIAQASEDVRSGRTLPVPRHLRSGGYQGAQRLDSGKGYQYPHDAEGGIVGQDYLGVDRHYYHPTDRGAEKELARRLREIREELARRDQSQK